MYLLTDKTTNDFLMNALKSSTYQNGYQSIILNSDNPKETVYLKVLDFTVYGTKFIIEVENVFKFFIMELNGEFLVYAYSDTENLSNYDFKSVSDICLINHKKIDVPFQKILSFFFVGFIHTLIKENLNNEIKHLQYDNFKNVRLIMLVLLINAYHVIEWKIKYIDILIHAVSLYLEYESENDKINILYNTQFNYFEVTIKDYKNVTKYFRNRIFIEELTSLINTKLSVIHTY